MKFYKLNQNNDLKMGKRILLIEICDFNNYPIGGYLSFAKQMLTAFGNQLVLVGICTDDSPIGKWIKKEIDGIEYDYFAVAKIQKTNTKTFIPYRLKSYLAVRKYRKEILCIGIENVFIQTPEVLFALKDQKMKNLCCRIPGVGNPMTYSRYWYGKFFSKIFDYYFFKELKKSNVILASADKFAIQGFIEREKGKLLIDNVIQFPTRINTDIFKPTDKVKERLDLNLENYDKIIVTTGRLSELKGWKFMIDCFVKYKSIYPNSIFIFLGDGEDRNKIETYIEKELIKDNVIISGRVTHEELSKYLNAADLYIMGSYIEGWATSLVEAVSCAKPVVCTHFSSANELIEYGVNGYVIEEHNLNDFVDAMLRCETIEKQNLILKSNQMQQYAVSNLKDSIFKHWELN